MMNKRVCLLTSVNSPFDFRLFFKECKSLAQAGYDVTLVAPHTRDEVVDGIRIKAVPKSKGRLARITLTVWCVYREAVRQQADVYLFPDSELIPVGLLLRLRGKKVVYDIRELVALQFLTKHYLPRWARGFCGWLVGRLQKLAVPCLSAIVVATPSIAKQFDGTKRQISIIVQNFPSPDELRPDDCLPWDQRPNWAVFIGGVSVDRGIHEILGAIDLLPKELRVSLKIAGEFDSQHLRDEVFQLPGWKRVEHLGFLDRPSVWRLLGRVRLGLVTLHPLPRHFAGSPVKLFEYMCAGIPVIASDFPLLREIVQGADCGLLVDPLNPEAIAQAIQYLLTHPTEAEAMGRRGREAVERQYYWQKEERKLLQLCASLVEAERPQ